MRSVRLLVLRATDPRVEYVLELGTLRLGLRSRECARMCAMSPQLPSQVLQLDEFVAEWRGQCEETLHPRLDAKGRA